MMESTASAAGQPDIEMTGTLTALDKLMRFAEADGDISPLLTDEAITKLSQQVCEQYERDKTSRTDWQKVAEKALKDMASCDHGTKDYPWPGASNVHYPLLAYAVMQFNARAYPAIVKGDEAVKCKVIGQDNGLPLIGPDGQPVMHVQGMPVAVTPQGPALVTREGVIPLPEGAQPEPAWQREPGAKTRRAARVAQLMNYMLFYRVLNWEAETDTLLMQIPAIGCGFRKTWYDGERHNVRFIPALKLVVDNDAKSLDEAPQIAEEIDGVFPHLIRRDIATGRYRSIDLDEQDHEARLLVEAQCYADLDGDGMDEPYIVTVDHKSKQLLRVVPDFGPEQVRVEQGKIVWIDRRKFYTKYEFLPHPEGKFYNIGLAHLLDQYGEVINTLLNQMLDANHAATAGGGFIASGLRIQGQGQSSSLKWRPGEYKTVSVSGAQLREGIVERTFPAVSPVAFQLLEFILGAARDIASIKDVLSGDASNEGQVGTTLALIEQGLQVFTAIYKRVYRGLKDDFTLLFSNVGTYADAAMQEFYTQLLDDPAADLAADFNAQDFDLRPVSDPQSVTRIQKMARGQFLLSTMEPLVAAGGDAREVMRRVYEAADIEDIDKLFPPPNPLAQMGQQIELDNTAADTEAKRASAFKATADGQAKLASIARDDDAAALGAMERGMSAGLADAA